MEQVNLSSKKAHKDAVIATECYRDPEGRKLPHLLFSASEDGFVKLWDFRVDKAVRLLAHPGLKSDSQSNMQVDSARGLLHIACEKNLLSFDIGTEKPIVNNAATQPISHDFVNCLDTQDNGVAYVDDE